jgi:2-iminobutanoate/2-iminopropanoate deaminase
VKKRSSRNPSASASKARAVRGPGNPGQRQYIRLNDQAPFSDGVLIGNTLYLAGRIGVDESGSHVPEDIETEAHNVMQSVESVLHRANMKMDDLVYVQVFCPDVSLWQRFNQIYCSYFKRQTLPARAFIGSGKLLFGAHFEVQGIAVRGS